MAKKLLNLHLHHDIMLRNKCKTNPTAVRECVFIVCYDWCLVVGLYHADS